MDQTPPRTAVIGAGISGLTAGKMLKDYGVPYTMLRDLRPGRRQLGVREPQRTQQRLPLAAHRHLASTGCPSRTSRCPSTIPTSRTTPRSRSTWTPTPKRSACCEHIEFRNGVVHAAPSRRRWLGDRGPGGRRRASSTCWSSRTDTTGTRGLPDFPGEFTGESIHSHHYIDPQNPLDLNGQADPGRRARQQRRRHHRRAVVEGAAEPGHAVDPVERVDRAEVHRGPARRQVLRGPRRTCRCRGSARRFR